MYKPLADSTLMAMTKKEIIEHLRIAEHNHRVCEKQIDQQYKNYLKLLNEEMADTIDECFAKIEERLNDTTTVSFDLPVEEILGEDIDMDDFIMLAEEIVQEYKSLVFSKLREAKKQLKEQLNE